MIDIPQELLLALILKSLLCGGLLGIYYELFRAIKMLFGVKYGEISEVSSFGGRAVVFAVTFITDLIFWVTAGLLSIAIIYSVGGGRFRGLTYIALALGFLVYYLTVGRLMLKVSAFLVKILKKAARGLIRLALAPIKLILRLIISLYHLTIGRIIGKIKVAVAASRQRRREAAVASIAETSEEAGGKEDLDFANGKHRYSKEGRIDFGRRADR